MIEPTPADIQAAFCTVVCDEWARTGVTDAVVAPGSRSTPMVAALDAESAIRVHVVLDERAAGFVALGLGLGSGRPAVVVTTSGTASVELHPAVVEAAQAQVPLIAVTTDRPPELHHVGAPQTVEQHGLFAAAARWSADPGVADLGASESWRSIAARTVVEAVGSTTGHAGPVHLNLPFREPLLGDATRISLPPGRGHGRPWHVPSPIGATIAPSAVINALRAHAGGKGLIVAGRNAASEPDAVIRLAEALGWPVLADPRSGCRLPSPLVVSSADALLRDPSMSALRPDAVLRLGEPWASKVVNQWLAAIPPEVPQVVATRPGQWPDPERRANYVVATTATALADGIGPTSVPETGWMRTWRDAEAAAQSALAALLDKGQPLDLSEPAVARATLAAVPEGGLFVTSSSMPVRDVEWYGAPRRGVTVLANRGANGIDGVLATSIGAALAASRPTVLLIGDLAFLYDAGSLLWAVGRQMDLTVVVVDNGGGGIFSFLPQAAALPTDRFERYWGTPHGLDLVTLACAYGVEARAIPDRAALDELVADSGRVGVRIGVVASDRAVNVTAHDRINAEVAKALRSHQRGQ